MKKRQSVAMTRGKKVKGRKRHLLVDTQGLLIEALVHSAGIQDRVAAKYLVNKAKTNGATCTHGYADGGYTGKFIDYVKQQWDVTFEIVKRTDKHTFVVLPKRWIIERTNAWISRHRRLAKDHERHNNTVHNWIYVAMTRLMLKRLAKIYT